MAATELFSKRAGGATAGAGVVVVRSGETGAVLWLWGEQDMATAAGVRSALVDAVGDGDVDVVVDLAGVTFMDASILSELIQGRLRMQARSRRLSVRAPSRCARRLLELCQLTEMIEPANSAAGDPLDVSGPRVSRAV